MKKKNLLFVLSILILFTSCSYLSKKPQANNHYTENLSKLINSNDSYKYYIFDMNFYKEKDLISDDSYIVNNFVKALDEKAFIKKPSSLGDKPVYKMMLEFPKEKYIINVYNAKYVTLHPWDGKEEMDYIDMTNLPASYNLFYLCNYIFSSKQ